MQSGIQKKGRVNATEKMRKGTGEEKKWGERGRVKKIYEWERETMNRGKKKTKEKCDATRVVYVCVTVCVLADV